ncbi:MAG: methionyl-tRNA formyltransferase, partial [Alphaproteobacteria bacterium]|nr:methionyl-tRNA formyltransferase [Alphaproteobacteria bacterium]
EAYAVGKINAVAQPTAGATYARKLAPEDGALDWRQPAALLERKVRALAPTPGAWFVHDGERIKVLSSAIASASAARGVVGEVIDGDLTIRCRDMALRLLRLQRPGRTPMSAAEFLRGYKIAAGTQLPIAALTTPS